MKAGQSCCRTSDFSQWAASPRIATGTDSNLASDQEARSGASLAVPESGGAMTVTSSRTNGFLFADLRDYTRYVETHGDEAAAALLGAYRALVRSAVAEFGGAEIKTEGDSFYVVFPSASSAVQCGLAILRAADERAREGGSPITVGIGVHAGETFETSEGYV